MSNTERVVLLIDMDCFYCQVEEKFQPTLVGKPIAVVQYNEWKGGGIIAVNYVAKNKGVTRHMRGDEAKKKCPDIQLVRVPVLRGKADLTKYRNAGKEVADVLLKFTKALERASVDEAYLDITETVKDKIASSEVTPELLKNTHVVGSSVKEFLQNAYHNDLTDDNIKLAIGGVIAEEIRVAVYRETGYKCSAGIAHNKMLAKLACGLHKPNQQTILPQDAVDEFFKTLPVYKIRNLGGKFGDTVVEDLKINTLGELATFTEKELMRRYDDKNGSWLYNIARGIDLEPVTTRLISKSIGSCKKFPGRTALTKKETIKEWLYELAMELLERLDNDLKENNRKAKGMTVSFTYKEGKHSISCSRVQVLSAYDVNKMVLDAYEILKRNCMRSDGTYHINFLGITATKFESLKTDTMDLKSFFKIEKGKESCSEDTSDINKMTNAVQKSEEIPSSSVHYESKQFRNVENNDKEVIRKKLNEDAVYKGDTSSLDNVENISAHNESNCDNSDESINNEVFKILNQEQQLCLKSCKDSFFSKYFSTLESSRDPKRNFNTSRCLENGDSSEDELVQDNVFITNSKSSILTDVIVTETVLNSKTSDKEVTNGPNIDFENIEENISGDEILCEKLPSPKISNKEGTDIVDFISENIRKDAANEIISEDLSSSKTFNKLNNVMVTDNFPEEKTLLTDTCPECGDAVAEYEFASHMDYHFALKLAQEQYTEGHRKLITYNNVKNKKSKADTVKSIKRKAPEENKNISISKYFKQSLPTENPWENAGTSNNMEACSKCGKMILVSEFQSHSDYHTAKELYLEINSIKPVTVNTNALKESKNVKSKAPSVISFFKPAL